MKILNCLFSLVAGLAVGSLLPVLCPGCCGAASATLVLKAGQPGPVINPNIYGQFSEHLGHCIYGGIWVGENSPIPNTRGIRNDVVRRCASFMSRTCVAGRLFSPTSTIGGMASARATNGPR